ncbi:MAG: glycosyltransferase family 1 protein [Clostridia bacterium]|nr:glycosyltransferase family 1 protein [Clostridia bacterium]
MEPIRILNVVGRMDRGGIETLIMNVYRQIDRSKVQFDFLAHYGKENADYNEEIRALGGRIYEMPVIKSTTKTYYGRFFTYCRALKKFFKEHPEYHVIHGHMTNTAAIYMPIAKKYGKVTHTIAHSHLTETQKTVSWLTALGTNLLLKPIRKQATDYFACSEMAALWLFKQEDLDAGRVHVISNGVHTEKFDFSPERRRIVRQKLGIEENIVLGHVGRFFPQKNHTQLLDIFHHYHTMHPNAVLLLVGEGELKEEMQQKAERLGLGDSVRFLGLRTDVEDLMQGMDLFLMPSLYEGLPVVGIEAQAAGLPMVVSTEITEELNITGQVRFVGLEESPEAWTKAIDEALTGCERTSTAETLKQAGYDIQTTAAFLQDFYLEKHGDAK